MPHKKTATLRWRRITIFFSYCPDSRSLHSSSSTSNSRVTWSRFKLWAWILMSNCCPRGPFETAQMVILICSNRRTKKDECGVRKELLTKASAICFSSTKAFEIRIVLSILRWKLSHHFPPLLPFHLSHHFPHLVELLDKGIDITDLNSRSIGDTQASTSI